MSSSDSKRNESVAMTGETGHKIYMIYSTKSVQELTKEFQNVAQQHKVPGHFHIRIEYERFQRKHNRGRANFSYKPSRDQAVCALSDEMYAALCKEKYDQYNRERNLRVVPYRFQKIHFPGEKYTFGFYIALPLNQISFESCKAQLSATFQVGLSFGWFNNNQCVVHYPTYPREADKLRGFALVLFSSDVPKENIVKARLMLDHTKLYISPSSQDVEKESNYINTRMNWALAKSASNLSEDNKKTSDNDEKAVATQ